MRVLTTCLLGLSLALFACGDDSSSSGGSPATGGGGAAAGGGGNGGESVGGGGQGGGVGGSAQGGSAQGGSAQGGSAPLCTGLPTGEVASLEFFDGFNGSEDAAFDGTGGLVAKNGSSLERVDAAKAVTTVAPLTSAAYGLRFNSAGDLFVALPQAGKIVKVTGGQVTDFKTGLSGPNGVHVDSAGNIWVTEFGGGRVIKLDPNGDSTTIASQLNSPNGVVLDETRNLLFFTGYSQGRLFKTDPAGGAEPIEVAQIGGAALDGLTLDACGNVYAVDQGNSRVYRLDLDADANLVGEPVMLAELPQNVANVQFGVGPGWNTTSLYAAGNPGVVYEIPVGVGAP